MVEFISKESMAEKLPSQKFKNSVNLQDYLRITEQTEGRTVVEIRSSEFAAAWYSRQEYEVDAGRLEVPVLYEPIYSVIHDSSFPKNVTVNALGPGGVVFEEVKEGGEVKFATLGESEYTASIKHYAVGLEYTKDLVIFNEKWNLGLIERAAGKAFNALLNHVHLSPILTATLTGSNATAASSDGTGVLEHTLRTFENAILAAQTDTTNPRQGPYVLLAGPADRFKIERALTGVPQVGTTVQSSVISLIPTVILYSGWTGTRGHKSVTYSGVGANTAYLIDVGNKDADFQSFVKQDLESARGNDDVTRFILEQVVWDTYFGVYANPTRAVQKITLPTT